jgi:hypothetical protein
MIIIDEQDSPMDITTTWETIKKGEHFLPALPFFVYSDR